MGSRDDEYFIQRAREGERQVFFAQNSPSSTGWSTEFWNIAKEQGLVPIFYDGAGRDIVPAPGMSNTLDNEINDDFYNAKTVVLYFGPPHPGKDYEDHWVLPNLRHVGDDRNFAEEGGILALAVTGLPGPAQEPGGNDAVRDALEAIESAERFIAYSHGGRTGTILSLHLRPAWMRCRALCGATLR